MLKLMIMLCALLTGCATPIFDPITVTYTSEPPGATLYFGQSKVGQTPYIGKHLVSIGESSQGYKVLPIITAVWPDGRQAHSPGGVRMSAGDTASYNFTYGTASAYKGQGRTYASSFASSSTPYPTDDGSKPSEAAGFLRLLNAVADVATEPRYDRTQQPAYQAPAYVDQPRRNQQSNPLMIDPNRSSPAKKEYNCRNNAYGTVTCTEN